MTNRFTQLLGLPRAGVLGAFAVLFVLTGLAAGCDSSSPGSPPPVAGSAYLRVVHLSPDAPPVDVYANGGPSPVVRGLVYKAATGYLEVPAGTYDFTVSATGTPAGSAVLRISGLMLEEGKRYSAVAYGALASIKALAIEDDVAGMASGTIRLRPVHVAAGVGTVDIWSLPASGSPAKIVSGLDFGSAAPALDLPAGAYTLGFDLNGDGHPELIFDVPALPEGTNADVFAVADTSGAFLQAQLADGTTADVAPRPRPAMLRVVHLSPDAPAVDVWVNRGAAPVITDLEFMKGTDYLEVPPGTYRFDVTATGASLDSAVLTADGVSLETGKSYTVAAWDVLDSIKALLLEDDYDGLPAGDIRVRAIHAAHGVGTVDLYDLPSMGSPALIVTDLALGQASAYLDLPAAAYTIGVDADRNGTVDLTFTLPAVPSGTFANLFAVDTGAAVKLIGQLSGGTVIPFDAM